MNCPKCGSIRIRKVDETKSICDDCGAVFPTEK